VSIRFRPVAPGRDADLLHAWVTHPRSAFWQMADASVEEVREEYARIADSEHHDAWLGWVDGEPAFLCETYDPELSPFAGLSGLSGLRPGDVGMHVLGAPPDTPLPGFTRRVFAAVMRHALGRPGARRVVVEPDVRNEAVLAMNARAGFVVDRLVELGSKTAALSFCTPDAFTDSEIGALP